MQRIYLLIALAAPAILLSQQYDLILKNGHVIDPKNNISGIMDVAIAAKKIVRVAKRHSRE